jgi:hypothetical protein
MFGAKNIQCMAGPPIIGLDLLTGLEEVTEDLVENNNVSEASSWAGTLYPH